MPRCVRNLTLGVPFIQTVPSQSDDGHGQRSGEFRLGVERQAEPDQTEPLFQPGGEGAVDTQQVRDQRVPTGGRPHAQSVATVDRRRLQVRARPKPALDKQGSCPGALVCEGPFVSYPKFPD